VIITWFTILLGWLLLEEGGTGEGAGTGEGEGTGTGEGEGDKGKGKPAPKGHRLPTLDEIEERATTATRKVLEQFFGPLEGEGAGEGEGDKGKGDKPKGDKPKGDAPPPAGSWDEDAHRKHHADEDHRREHEHLRQGSTKLGALARLMFGEED
jgi:hypothetical protein